MSNNSRPSVSVTIFDRNALHGSDVPVFSSALRNKVNTPVARELDDGLAQSTLSVLATLKDRSELSQIQTQKVGEKSEDPSSRADSFGGQTNEFAQGAESELLTGGSESQVPALDFQTVLPIVHRDKNSVTIQPQQSPLFESPEIFWSSLEVAKLHTFLLEKVPFVYTTPSLEHLLLESIHQHGIVDRIILPTRQISTLEALEPYRFLIQRSVLSLANASEAWTISSIAFAQDLLHQGEIVLGQEKVRVREYFLLLGSQLQGKKEKWIAEFKLGLEKIGVRYTQLKERLQIPKIELKPITVSFPTIEAPTIALPVPIGLISKIIGAKDEISALLRMQRMRFSLVTVASRTLIAGSMVLMLLTVGPMVALEAESWRQQIAFSIQNLATQAVEKSYPTPTLAPQATPSPSPTPNPDPDKQFQVLIPKIGVNSKIVANVDAGNEKEYTEALKKGVAHAKGTGLPGEANTENKTIFIFGHSTNATWNIARYNALFYSLKDLGVGDEFSVWFWGKEFQYAVTERKIVEPDDVTFLLPQTVKDQLILQTCWPPGTSAKRLLVIAEPKN